MRKDWDKYFMDIAFMVSERSTCPRLHVGAVLVNDKRIKATGYNGSPKGLPHCDEAGCLMVNNHCVRTIHAEVNCLLEVSPQERQGATMYVTHAPCPECQKLIITSGIKRVIYCNEYTPAINWFDQAEDIEVEKLQE
jgi:dCMP deaminase